ncbi:MAG: prepilin-type N-terminal cleavage/methylation domain-containing protein [Nitrospinae bacterium]|nr:prepilin-type N-terminal cleavage/methylation domain-containing protein [Nitrospinota bacterium]
MQNGKLRNFKICNLQSAICNLRGFSLLELIVVMTIIGIIAALVPPLMTHSMTKLKMKTTVKEISASLRFARNQAISKKATHFFFLNIDSKKYWLSEKPYIPSQSLTEEEKMKRGINLIKTIDDEIEIEGFKSNMDSDKTIKEGVVSVKFYPQGNSSGGIIFVKAKDKILSIDTDVFTGRVKVLTIEN